MDKETGGQGDGTIISIVHSSLCIVHSALMFQCAFLDHSAFRFLDTAHHNKRVWIDLFNFRIELTDLEPGNDGVNNLNVFALTVRTKAAFAFIYGYSPAHFVDDHFTDLIAVG